MSCSSVNPEIKPSSSAMGMLATRAQRGSRVGMCDATNRQRARFGNASGFASEAQSACISKTATFQISESEDVVFLSAADDRAPSSRPAGEEHEKRRLNYETTNALHMKTFDRDRAAYDN